MLHLLIYGYYFRITTDYLMKMSCLFMNVTKFFPCVNYFDRKGSVTLYLKLYSQIFVHIS